MRKISNIEVVEELIYQDQKVLGKRNLFEGQKIEMVKKMKRLSMRTNPVIENILERSGASNRAI